MADFQHEFSLANSTQNRFKMGIMGAMAYRIGDKPSKEPDSTHNTLDLLHFPKPRIFSSGRLPYKNGGDYDRFVSQFVEKFHFDFSKKRLNTKNGLRRKRLQ